MLPWSCKIQKQRVIEWLKDTEEHFATFWGSRKLFGKWRWGRRRPPLPWPLDDGVGRRRPPLPWPLESSTKETIVHLFTVDLSNSHIRDHPVHIRSNSSVNSRQVDSIWLGHHSGFATSGCRERGPKLSRRVRSKFCPSEFIAICLYKTSNAMRVAALDGLTALP